MHELTRLAGKRTVDDVIGGIRRRAEYFPPVDREVVLDLIARSRE